MDMQIDFPLYERMSPTFWKIRLTLNTALHFLEGPDHGNPHDHPFDITSTVMKGGYIEEVFDVQGNMRIEHRKVGDTFVIGADHIHRIVELPEDQCVTHAVYHEWQRPFRIWRFENGVAEWRNIDGDWQEHQP